ncbi:MAG: hypothetical protein JNK05_15790 [Myxococcales bacterium]|nr:hypothetical protein [Myxococcales bacterium]
MSSRASIIASLARTAGEPIVVSSGSSSSCEREPAALRDEEALSPGPAAPGRCDRPSRPSYHDFMRPDPDPAAHVELLRSRTFRLWIYTVSHQSLLLRSVRTKTIPTRVDVAFVCVDAVYLPTTLESLIVVERSADWFREVNPTAAAPSSTSRVFQLDSTHNYFIVAGNAGVYIDELGDFDPSQASFPSTVWR